MSGLVGGVRAHVEGEVARDAEVRETKTGKPWCPLRVRVAAPGFAGGEPRSVYVTCKAFGPQATKLEGVREGQAVKLRGAVGLDRWTGRDGRERHTLEVLVHAIDELGPLPAQPEPSAFVAEVAAAVEGEVVDVDDAPREPF